MQVEALLTFGILPPRAQKEVFDFLDFTGL